MSEPIIVGPDHPFWHAIATNDDDWCGSAATNWCNNHVKGKDVIVYPAKDCDTALLEQVKKSLLYFAQSVDVKPAGTPVPNDKARKKARRSAT